VRLECPSCKRLAPAAGFRVDGARLLLRCGRCGAESVAFEQATLEKAVLERASKERSVARGAPAQGPLLRVVPGEGEGTVAPPDGALFDVPEGHCPKCVASRPPEALACPACGLVFSNWAPEEHTLPAPLADAWHRLQARWGEVGAHDAFLAQAQRVGQLAAAGRLYRIQLARRPGEAQARRALEEVVRLALLPSERPEVRAGAEQGKARPLKLVLALLFLLACLMVGALLLRAAASSIP
jgi:hypothetical protein